MQDRSLNDVTPGAVLARPVLDQKGRVLLQTGSVLTEALLSRLEKWRVSSVSIETPDPSETACSDEERAPNEVHSWDEIFAPHGDSPEMQRIHQAFVLWSKKNQVSPHVRME